MRAGVRTLLHMDAADSGRILSAFPRARCEGRGSVTEAELVGLVQLVAQYDGLATSLRALRIQPDRPR